MRNSIVLIGMPSSGKTTIGRELSKRLKTEFFDTDEYMVEQLNQEPSDLLSEMGEEKFLEYEAKLTIENAGENMVISTSGSIPMLPKTMEKLKEIGVIFWICPSLDVLKKRFNNRNVVENNRIVLMNMNYDELYNYRSPYYNAAMEVKIEVNDTLSTNQIIDQILNKLHQN